MERNEEKIRKQKNSFDFGINIKLGLWPASLAVVAGLVWAFGVSISTVVGIYLGYRVLRLVLQLFGLLFRVVFTVISIIILIAIISLLIF